jgi:serine/threonine protein kinase
MVWCTASLQVGRGKNSAISRSPPPPRPPQGGLPLASVLTLLKQVLAALMHLHSLGILHRDLRAANVLMDCRDPLRALVADLGVSHQLSAFATRTPAADQTASKVTTVLTGRAALGPFQVGAD